MVSYRKWINSKEWRNRSKILIECAEKCEKCDSTKNLECHHENYDHLGSETEEDIMVLCDICHKKVHEDKKNSGGKHGRRHTAKADW